MWKRTWIFALLGLLAVGALIPIGTGLPTLGAALPQSSTGAPAQNQQNPYSDAWLAANHGQFDNIWTAEYESQLQQSAQMQGGLAGRPLSPLYGPDVRMSNGNLLGSNQNEFQIAINPTNNLNAIGTSNDGGTAGVGIFRTTDGGLTWTSHDASTYSVPPACCDPGVVFGSDGRAYVIILDTSPAVTYIIRSTDGGATWPQLSQVATPDRPNIAVDPTNPDIVYLTYSELTTSNRIKGYKSTDGGQTWGATFFVGDVAPAQGYEQASQPQVASNGWLYVGYQQYTSTSAGCAAGVQNVLARSTDGGATFNYTVVPIVQGGACSPGQAGRGIFCINATGGNFRSRAQFVVGIKPNDPTHVYVIYAGGDQESAYTCAGSNGFHSDILFRRSTDSGATFTAATKINTDGQGSDQYFPWMGVTESGQIWVGWNDRRDDPNDYWSRWYQAHSDDEGTSWRQIDGTPGNDAVADVQTHPNTFPGDYHGLAARNGLVLGMWFDTRNNPNGDAYTDPQVLAQGTVTPTITGTPPAATGTSTPPPATSTRTATPGSGSPTPAPPSATATNVPPSATSTMAPATATGVPASATPAAGSPTATPTECPITFSDVHPTDYFYEPVRYLYCHGVISGYGDNTFRPYNDTTRAQMVKIVVLGFGIPVQTPAGGAYTFHDVPPAAPFFDVIETAAAHNIVSGYNCGPGGPGPCDPQNRGYFLPNNPVTRGQLSKIDVIAAGWPQLNPTTPTFTDVPQANPFYTVIETAVCHGVVSGYADHTFHPFANATRGQISKIVYLSLLNTPGSCALTPAAGTK